MIAALLIVADDLDTVALSLSAEPMLSTESLLPRRCRDGSADISRAMMYTEFDCFS
jgi:hypothetical protein